METDEAKTWALWYLITKTKWSESSERHNPLMQRDSLIEGCRLFFSSFSGPMHRQKIKTLDKRTSLQKILAKSKTLLNFKTSYTSNNKVACLMSHFEKSIYWCVAFVQYNIHIGFLLTSPVQQQKTRGYKTCLFKQELCYFCVMRSAFVAVT